MAEKTAIVADSVGNLAAKVAEKADRIKYLVIAVIAALVVAALAVGWMRSREAARDAAANAALFKAEIDASGKTTEEVAAIFGKVASEYAGMSAAEQALVYQFAYFFYTGRFKEAEAPLRDHMENYPASRFAARVRLALAQTLLEQGDLEGTKRELDALGNDSVDVMPEARLVRARVLEREADGVGTGDAAEYRRRLELAREAYFDIVNQAQARTTVWPRTVVQDADFSLLMINDKLAGYEYRNPLRPPAPAGTNADGAAAVEPPVPALSPETGEEAPEAAAAAPAE